MCVWIVPVSARYVHFTKDTAQTSPELSNYIKSIFRIRSHHISCSSVTNHISESYV